ncbi:hypothetical protein [Labilibaculum antarcticum]|uniref:Uncharacterized protein n=1 Tax=Labilibaculum antarcticum TaxID=1717717 RepID=A0A1Y1CLS1_9BACT|nr:hypothetical protein [Labilibaculum antarcticum]BAX81244.1 hypothetical protein ALGA_2939 [Labilibaculum antarcticum]
MKPKIYLNLTPEALIASMLSPEEFGSYMAVGTQKRTHGQVLFLEVDSNAIQDILPMDYINERCVPQEEGRPKSSVYLSIYRVLESIPVSALKSLYLTTDDGRTMEIKKGDYPGDIKSSAHLYQELCPVTPRIISKLAPLQFIDYMTKGTEKINLPKLAFVELQLNGLTEDFENSPAHNLPYPELDHLRDCLKILNNEPGKIQKTIRRFFSRDLLFRTIKNGFFIGDSNEMVYYPFPSEEELNDKNYVWWRSAKSNRFN